MSFQAMAEAVRVPLPAPQKCLLIMLANYANQDYKCYPSIARLSLDAGISKSSAKRYLKTFEQTGLISVERRRIGESANDTNIYTLNLSGWSVGRATVDPGGSREGEGVGSLCPKGGATVNPKPINEPINKNLLLVENEILDLLNNLTGRKFKTPDGVAARLKDGYSKEDLELVIRYKVRKWGASQKMREYLRPKTLFAKGNFHGYLEAAKEAVEFDQSLDSWGEDLNQDKGGEKAVAGERVG